MHILLCVGSKFCVKFQRAPLKFHTKFWTHTPQNMHFTVFYFNMIFTTSLNCDVISLSETGPWDSTRQIQKPDGSGPHCVWRTSTVHANDFALAYTLLRYIPCTINIILMCGEQFISSWSIRMTYLHIVLRVASLALDLDIIEDVLITACKNAGGVCSFCGIFFLYKL